jgi:hypothetical protein
MAGHGALNTKYRSTIDKRREMVSEGSWSGSNKNSTKEGETKLRRFDLLSK